MATLNVGYSVLIFEDCNNTKNPDVRLPDITRNIEGIQVDFDKSERCAIYTNEIKDIVTTQRTVAWDSTTQLQFVRPVVGSNTMRIFYTGTGTAPAFRTKRAIAGDVDTTVSITRVTDYVARIQNTSGTVWSLGTVQTNDLIRFEKNTQTFTSPFATINVGTQYVVQAVGADYIDFIDNGASGAESGIALGADFATALKVITQGPAKVTDIIELSGAGLNPSNYGRFEITDVSNDYIEIINPLGVEQTVLYGTNSLVIYEYLIGFVLIRASGPIKIRVNAQSEWMPINRLGAEAIFFGSVLAHKIQAMNEMPNPVSISIQHAMVS